MENSTEQPAKRSIIIWGVPVVILLALIVLLIMELTGDEETAVEPARTTQETAIQPTDEQGVTIEVEPILETKQEEVGTGTEVAAMQTTEEEEGAALSDEKEQSYIVEEGDNLWKIAKRKDVLDDAWKWRTILIQNREKINYTIFSEETGEWKVMVDAGKRLVWKPRASTKSKTSFDRTRKKRYAVQLMSLNMDQLDRAVDIVKFLIKDGYHAYLYRTRDKIKTPNIRKAQFFYRIRVGFFETEREALSVGEDIVYQYEDKDIFPPDYWAVLPSYSELNGELIDFGIQRNKPWIIQLAEQTSRSEAINDLKVLASLVDFTYISQKQMEEGDFKYRIRVGFYETKGEANKTLSKIQSRTPGKFHTARIMEIRHVMEDAIGQSTGRSSLKKLR
ncbi:MAG: hypothetical protein GY866_02415 [Proteobacteria bacterium]|nr:hypothetical protein [Pseudomonadota bacterium]